MARHNVQKQIEEIAEIKKVTIEEAAALTGADLTTTFGAYEAWGRAHEAKVYQLLGELKDEKKNTEIRSQIMTGYGWIKIAGEWLVKGDFSDKKVDDHITVTRVNGTSQQKQIVEIIESGRFARVW